MCGYDHFAVTTAKTTASTTLVCVRLAQSFW
ncbi:hypothetical protein L916_17686 [Phytophthora nicotianae]|nr:hypothetical protein L916_17686 [Phytophthora nicotianae]